jgi:hypothetical protein
MTHYTKRGTVRVDSTILADYDRAVSYLRTSRAGKATVDEFETTASTVRPFRELDATYDHAHLVLHWNPHHYAFFVGNARRRTSSADVLVHEMRHAVQTKRGMYDYNSAKYQDGYYGMMFGGPASPDEADATVVQAQVARELGEPIRQDYFDGDTADQYVADVTSHD